MKKTFLPLSMVAILVLAGCGNDQGNNQVISKRFIHKYGYAVSESEWDANNYPGQIVTTLRSGVTITSTHENGVLHGPTTHTHPHSQTVEYLYLYNFGEVKKEIVYDSLGMPVHEKVKLSPQRFCITMWYGDGTPMSVEDFAGEELLDGEYFTINNDIESKVQRGIGMRTRRDQHGLLLAKDYFEDGYLHKKETFYPTGEPESISFFRMNKKDGERRVFSEGGEPLAVEEWIGGQLHGKAAYYKNGNKQVEVYFINDARNGLETHFIDGDRVEQEISWNNDRRHGPTKFYVNDAVAKTEWYYNGKLVPKKRYDDLIFIDQMVTQGSAEFNEKKGL